MVRHVEGAVVMGGRKVVGFRSEEKDKGGTHRETAQRRDDTQV